MKTKARAATMAGLVLGAALLFGSLLATRVDATGPMTQSDIEERLTCQCGCGLTVHSCNHLQCGFGEPVKRDIANSLAAGQTGKEILARYVAEYGEKILSSPTHSGFNLLAWYGPYVAVALGALAILFVIRRWSADGSGGRGGGAPAAGGPAMSEEDRSRLQRELEDLEG
jgi:cytochrome c-type biogenesis protein CcmH